MDLNETAHTPSGAGKARTERPSVKYALLSLRSIAGVMYLVNGISKLAAPHQSDTFMTKMVESGLERSWGFYKTFLAQVVQPAQDLFLVMVTWGELALGLALLAGLAQRLALPLGLFMMLNFTLLKGPHLAAAAMDLILIVLLTLLLWQDTGRRWGLDRRISAAWPRYPF